LKPAADENEVARAQQKTGDCRLQEEEASPMEKRIVKGSRKQEAKRERAQMAKTNAEKQADRF